MEDNRKEQAEALEVLQEFNDRLIKNIGILIKELSGSRLDDTDKFIKGITDAMNWEIQVMNGTMELLNEGKQRIDKEAFRRSQVLGKPLMRRMMRRWQRLFQRFFLILSGWERQRQKYLENNRTEEKLTGAGKGQLFCYH